MIRTLVRCAVSLALFATSSSAGPGVSLRWNNCLGDGGAISRTFACDTNAGVNALVGSFELGVDLLGVAGVEIVIDLTSRSATLPAWWELNQPGTCRTTALRMNGVISPSAVACEDWSNGAAAGLLVSYVIGFAGPNTARMFGGFSVTANSLADLSAGKEYFAFNATLSNIKTAGAGACAGCLVPVMIVLDAIRVVTPPPPLGQPARDVWLTGPVNGTDSHLVTWQGATFVPTRSSTWSELKSLYR